MATGIESIADKVISAPTINLVPEIPGEQFAVVLAAMFKLGDDFLNILSSPAMVAARQRQDVQAILNQDDADLKEAQKTGDISTIDKEASG